jgi:hypothetical protein
VAYCLMLDFVPYVETCSSSSSSDSSRSESVRAWPPPIPNLFIFAKLGDMPEMLEVEATRGTVPVETEAHAASHVGEFSCLCMFCMLWCFC